MMTKGVLVAYLCLTWNTLVIASGCNDFFLSPGDYLKNHVIEFYSAPGLPNCTSTCLQSGPCESTNFNFYNKTCELNNADKHDFPGDYIQRPGYGYSGWRNKEEYPNSCADAKRRDPATKSGYYLVKTRKKKLKVYCDMETHGGGWTLVVSIDSSNREHLQTAANNCLNQELCVEHKTSDIPARKLSDEDIVDLVSEQHGTFRVDVHTGTPYTAFYRIPSGAKHFDSSCTGLTPCARIIISHHYPYVWETNSCSGVDIGYRIYRRSTHYVFDNHDDGECKGVYWHSTLYNKGERLLYGYNNAGDTGIYSKKQGLLYVK